MSEASPVTTMETRDPGELEEWSALQGWEAQYVQLESGGFRATFEGVQLGRTVLTRERWGRRISILATISDDVVPMGVVLNAPRPGSHSGVPHQAGDLLFMRPGSELDLVAPSGSEVLAIHVSKSHIERVGLDLGLSDPLHDISQQKVVRSEPWIQRTLLRDISDSFEPDSADTPLAAAERESRIINHFLSALDTDQDSRATPSLDDRLRGAKRAREYIEENLNRTVCVEDIARASGVGARALQLWFKERYEVAPMQYLRNRRLRQVRERLLKADPDNLTVAEVATANGFSHLGRFSEYYRRTFGELPSETLRSRRLVVSYNQRPPGLIFNVRGKLQRTDDRRIRF